MFGNAPEASLMTLFPAPDHGGQGNPHPSPVLEETSLCRDGASGTMDHIGLQKVDESNRKKQFRPGPFVFEAWRVGFEQLGNAFDLFGCKARVRTALWTPSFVQHILLQTTKWNKQFLTTLTQTLHLTAV